MPRVDLVVGADILYEPEFFEALLGVLRRAAPRALLVQNTARRGTDFFKELCREQVGPFPDCMSCCILMLSQCIARILSSFRLEPQYD